MLNIDSEIKARIRETYPALEKFAASDDAAERAFADLFGEIFEPFLKTVGTCVRNYGPQATINAMPIVISEMVFLVVPKPTNAITRAMAVRALSNLARRISTVIQEEANDLERGV